MSTHYQGSPKEKRALDAYVKLMRATESVTARIHAPLNSVGLTSSQLGVLEALVHLGPLSQKMLARKLLKTGGNITMVIDNLEKRGLVSRQRQIDDRRVIHVQLTEVGRQLIEQIFPTHVKKIMEEMAILSPTEMQDLARLCRKLGRQEEKNE